jgi:hypothetical protein
MSEAKDDSSDKVPAVLVMADSCRKAAEEGIAEDLEGRVRIGGHPAGVCANTEKAVDVVFQTSAQAIAKVGPVRGSPAVEFMRKAHTAGHVGPQFVFGAEEHVKAAKLELVDIRIKRLHVERVWELLFAIRCRVAVPHELKLCTTGDRIIDERSEAYVAIRAELVEVYVEGEPGLSGNLRESC